MKPLLLPAPKYVTLRVGPVSPADIRRLCGVSRLREFETVPSFGPNRLTTEKTWPYKGKYKTYPKLVHHAHIVSHATLSPGMATIRHALRPTVCLRAPAGMEWQTDDHGLLLRRMSDGMDYHPTTEDLHSKCFATRVRENMALAFNRRRNAARLKRQQERDAKIYERDLPGVRVTLADSRAAGNCVEGSLAFCERRLHIPREEVLAGSFLFSAPAPVVLRAANGDRPKAEAAVRRAWLRETTVSI